VLVRTDLTAPQICVQAIHAAIESTRNFLPPDSEHPHLVLCGVATIKRLLAAADYLFLHGIRHTLFREPDRDNEPTALATEPLCGERCALLNRFRCLTSNDFVSRISPNPN
jgi:hypothetical protein